MALRSAACSHPIARAWPLFDAGKIVSFGDPVCRERLRARLPELEPLALGDLEIRPCRIPPVTAPDAWILERPYFDLVVRARPPSR